MSHNSERKEKVCLNCKAAIIGRYCHKCGQENREPKESLWHFTTHFFNDVTHFDGKFFTTLKDLLFRPGFLSKEYMIGKRASYLDPVRMYLFTSFLFFLVFFSMKLNFVNTNPDARKIDGKPIAELLLLPQNVQDSITAKLNEGKPMTRAELEAYAQKPPEIMTFGDAGSKYKDIAEFDSAMTAKGKKISWLQRTFMGKQIEIDKKYAGRGNDLANTFQEILVHKFPQILFISLPFVALFLKLLYIRRKQYYYVSHAVFSIHLYIFIFIIMLVQIGLSKIDSLAGISFFRYINFLLTGAILFYLYKAMRNFYMQRRLKTFIKYFLFLGCFVILIAFLLIFFILLSAMQV